MFSYFRDIVDNRHRHAQDLKERKGKKIIGYMCSYVPEEIIYAAGGIPIRLFTNEEPPSLADNFMQNYYCTFARSILHQGLGQQFSYMDGLVTAYSCTTMRLAFDNLQKYAGFKYTKFLYMPGVIDTPESKDYYHKELKRFKLDMQDLFDRTISDDDLREAIHVYDENRSLILKIFEGRKENPPTITGEEAYLLTLSSMLTDKAQHSKMLKKLIDELPKRKPLKSGINRLMIVGSPLDNLKLLRLIEQDIGAWVVTDDTCTGTRYIWGNTPSDYISEDPLKAVVERYMISRPPCPTKHSPTRWVQCRNCPFRTVPCFFLAPSPKKKALAKPNPFQTPERICRFRHALQIGINHKVEGVIALTQKFCDPHGFDYHHVVQSFEDVGIPSVFVEVDNIVSIGQTLTRIEAFVEMIQPVDYMIKEEIKDAIKL